MEVATRVIRPETSERLRYLMRLNAEKGTARRADVDGFYVGGKTGTSEKVFNGRYVRNRLLNSFTAVFPADQPKYLLLVMLDEPQGLPETGGLATAGLEHRAGRRRPSSPGLRRCYRSRRASICRRRTGSSWPARAARRRRGA